MKNIKQIRFVVLIVILSLLKANFSLHAQCVETLGSATNINSTFENATNQIIVNNDLNTVIFIHRNDISLYEGDNGNFKYDISTDNGNTWQLNQGNLNPGSTLGVNGGRYPQVGLYNPEGNTDLSNATIVYHGPTVSTDFDGYVSGSQLLDGATPPTENYNQAGVTNILIPGGFCQSTPGTFWTVDEILNGGAGGIIGGIRILKGIYAAGDVTWTVNAELTPDFNTDVFGAPTIQEWSMAFDPSGNNGWVVFLSHLNGLADYNYHPVFYNTTDGGATWNGPIQLDLSSFSSITSVEPNPGGSYEVDITVDNNGNPHALMGVFTSGDFYSVFLGPGHMFDMTYDGVSWNAINLGQTSYTYVPDPGLGNGTLNRPQISRSDDGSKIVFTWVDSDLPEVPGTSPNLKAVTYDVPTGTVSCPINYAAKCPSVLNNQMYVTTVSPNMIEDAGVYTVPVVLTIRNVSGSGNDPVQFYYLNDLSIESADFTAANSGVYPTITVNGSNPICAGGTVVLEADAQTNYFWNTGETTASISVTQGGTYWVINPDISFCIGSTNSVNVNVIAPAEITAFGSTYLCGGASVELFANYNTGGTDFFWSTGETTQSIIVSSAGSYVVTVDGACPSLPLEVQVSTDTYRPTISYSSLSICYPGTVTLTANTNSSYLWNTGETTQSIEVDYDDYIYYYGNIYWVVNPDMNYCVDNTNTVDVTLNIVEISPFAATPITVCNGNTIDLTVFSYTASGNNFLWSNGETTPTITTGVSGLYTATIDGCAAYNSVEIVNTSTPVNDNICNAQVLNVGALTTLNNSCATVQTGEPLPPRIEFTGAQNGWFDEYVFGGGPVLDNTVWFSFKAPVSGAVNISSSFDAYPYDTQLALYSSSNGTCTGTLTLVAANDDSGIPGFEFSSLINQAYCLTPNKRYFVQVDGYAGTIGAGTIQVTAVPNTVTICHKVSGQNPVTLSVSGCSLNAHLAHGDNIGACVIPRISSSNEGDVTALTLDVYPNPVMDEMHIDFISENVEKYQVQIIDLAGRSLMTENGVAVIGENSHIMNLGKIAPGVYFMVISKGKITMQTKIVME